jgi:hypothetical protein
MNDTINETVDDLTISEFEEGTEVIKQLDKEILTKGAWVTAMYKYQEFDAKTQDYGIIKYTIRRYQKRNGKFKQRSKFNITSNEQANKIVSILQNWMDAV